MRQFWLYGVIIVVFCASPSFAETIVVQSNEDLRQALRGLKHGTTIRITSGNYSGGHAVVGVDDLTIEAADRNSPPLFRGGTNAWHFSKCKRLALRDLKIQGQTGNGLNIDDGGDLQHPIEDVLIERIEISEIGPQGNHDGIKCSGVNKLRIDECRLHGWGGQGIDLVGCQEVRITGCRLEGKEGFSATAGVQCKGGTSRVLIEKCHWIEAGERPINVGGSTGLPYFRPSDAPFEASQIRIRNCVIEGSLCAAAFVGVDGAEFVENKILFPKKWIFRILQETKGERFAPCRNVLIAKNEIRFRRKDVQVEVNIGSGTSPETFQFKSNRWLAEDQPENSKPKLPVVEEEGYYGK